MCMFDAGLELQLASYCNSFGTLGFGADLREDG